MICDAHNHLQDTRLNQSILSDLERLAIGSAVVNGTSEKDWPQVLALAEKHSWVVPSLGLHPWFVNQRSSAWKPTLEMLVGKHTCGVGEMGLDRWIENPDCAAQEDAFAFQLGLAAKHNRPASIHCLKAWGRMHELLRAGPLPRCGFLLHSYNGPAEMLKGFLDLGAFISISGYFAHPRKEKQRDVFRSVPLDRILVETDAPDMLLPEDLDRLNLTAPCGGRLNHPGNLPAVYEFAANLHGIELPAFSEQVESNFRRLFATILK